MGIRFNYADVKSIPVKRKTDVKEFVCRLFDLEGKKVKEMNYIFCSDNYLLKINRDFLQHDYYTDIITFDLSEADETVGEVYISVDRVRENAKAHEAPVEEEMLRVILHGALHLVGYKDKKKSEKKLMRGKEDYYLRLFEKK